MRKKHNSISITITILSGLLFLSHAMIGVFMGVKFFYRGYGRVTFMMFIITMILSMAVKDKYNPVDDKISKEKKKHLLKISNIGIFLILIGILFLYIVIIFAPFELKRYVLGLIFTGIACLGLLLVTSSDYKYSRYVS